MTMAEAPRGRPSVSWLAVSVAQKGSVKYKAETQGHDINIVG